MTSLAYRSLVALDPKELIINYAINDLQAVTEQRGISSSLLSLHCNRHSILVCVPSSSQSYDTASSMISSDFPDAHMIPGVVEINGAFAKSGGAFTDLWKGTYQNKSVAVKVLRLSAVGGQASLKKSFCEEGALWSQLHHKNVLPFIGVATKPFHFSLVFPWMMHGNIRDYMKNNPQANRLPLVTERCSGRAGILALKNIVNGDLKGPNIWIKDDERACLADFDLTTIVSATISGYQPTVFSGGTLRWMAPELLAPEKFGFERCIPSIESDIYAFGMVVYEVVTGNSPFVSELCKNEEVIPKVLRGDRPERPTKVATINLVKAVWPIAEKCWSQVARERLTLPQVSELLDVEIAKWNPEEQPQIEPNTKYESKDDTDMEIIVGKLYPTG